MELQQLVMVLCCVCIAGDGSSRTFQCGRWIAPSSSQPLSLATSTLQHSCCPACSIADSGVTALPVQQALLIMWLRHQLIGALVFCESWAKTVKQNENFPTNMLIVWNAMAFSNCPDPRWVPVQHSPTEVTLGLCRFKPTEELTQMVVVLLMTDRQITMVTFRLRTRTKEVKNCRTCIGHGHASFEI